MDQYEIPTSYRESSGLRDAKVFHPDPAFPNRLICFDRMSPGAMLMDEFRCFLYSAVLSGVSDFTFQSGQFIKGQYNKGWRVLSPRRLLQSEVEQIIAETFDASAISMLKGRKVLSYAYALNLVDGGTQRFRVEATSCLGGYELSFRALSRKTPDFEMNRLSEVEAKAMRPLDGIVAIAGSTASGKTTALASIIGAMLKDQKKGRKIIDLQRPVEYDYSDILCDAGPDFPSSLIQHGIGQDIETFEDALISCMRRNPCVINIGEAKETETFAAAIDAAISGHLTYTTLHANSVVDTFSRFLSGFSGGQLQEMGSKLASSSRFFTFQVLVPHKSGNGVVPLREYLEFSGELRRILRESSMDRWGQIIEDRLYCRHDYDDGAIQQTMRESCIKAVNEGLVSEETIHTHVDAKFGKDE